MAGIIRSLQTLELRLDERLDRFISRYPHMAYPIIFFGMPVLVLTAVFFLTSPVNLPVALIFGWQLAEINGIKKLFRAMLITF